MIVIIIIIIMFRAGIRILFLSLFIYSSFGSAIVLSQAVEEQSQGLAEHQLSFESEDLEYAHEIHEAIDRVHVEGRGLSAWIREWIGKLNVVSWGFRFYRGASLVESRRFGQTTYDVLFLMSLSHPLEMASGPTLVSMGISNGWPTWLIASLGFGGAIISAPGLDPLCIILVGSYFSIPVWRKTVRWTREKLLSALFWGSRVSGLNAAANQAWNAAVITENRVENFVSRSESFWPDTWFNFEREPNRVYLKFFSPNGYFQLGLKIYSSPDGEVWLEEVALSQERISYYPHFRHYLSGLGWNLRNAVKELSKIYERYELRSGEHWPFYVEEVVREAEADVIKLKPGAIRISKERRLRSPLEALRLACKQRTLEATL